MSVNCATEDELSLSSFEATVTLTPPSDIYTTQSAYPFERILLSAKDAAITEENLSEKAKEHLDKFKAAIENDLSTPQALSQLQVAIKDSSLKPEEIVTVIKKMDCVLGLKIVEEAEKLNKSQSSGEIDSHADDPEAAEINALVIERTEAKKAKDFAKADQIRNQLAERGITIIDTPQGAIWKRN